MKKVFFAAVSVLMLLNFSACEKKIRNPESGLDSHNARNSLDWAGVYTGTIPSADTAGIDVRFVLNGDGTYAVDYQYMGASDVFTYTGTFRWDDRGTVITLEGGEIPPHYRVGENTLTQLDMGGDVIAGPLAESYVLKKQP